MILEFSCSNHKSIKDMVTFSSIAGSDDTFENTLKVFNNHRVLRSAVIYGANGSGKSNFISALVFMKDLVANSIKHQPGQGIFQAPHKLSSLDTPSEYKIQFIKDDVRYAYGFSIVKNAVKDEYLYYFPNGRQVKIFERDNMKVKPGDKYKNSFELSLGALKDNRLFLSCIANYTNLAEVEAAFIFFSLDIVVYNPMVNNWTEFSIELLQSTPEVKKIFIDVLQALGTGIQDVRVKLEKVKPSVTDMPQKFPDALKSFFATQDASKIEAKVIYKEFETDLMAEESTGIKKLFEMICPIIDIVNKGKILICDEIETSLHESVVYEIVRLFQNARKDVFAQLIFSTHDTSLLDSNLFRRDQIWFTELNATNRSTDLFSLAEIRNVRKTENLGRGYVSGKYGGIPMLNKSFFQSFGDMK
ncbi:AAA family ATPase [Anaerosporobacter sp.]|uniref:AAA family ATPase n=1 Tax=Anaerosporobacter sp. TaxID=1872529 RepID=UPI00286F22F0|nr:ATP-binding protein [Anaerosporobacter sp.]